MKMKMFVLVAMAALLSLAVGYDVTSKPRGTRILRLAPPSHKKKKKVKINFSKHKAAGIKCKNCHRKHKSGRRHYKKCGKCHNTVAKAQKIGHLMCRVCHTKRKAAGKKHGPTKANCNGCHKY